MALTVCVGHLGLNTVAAKVGFQVRFELAVDIFFALSGYVLAQSYYFGRRPFSRLLAGRIARLYPLHLATLAWVAILMVWRPAPFPWLLLIQNVLLIHNIGFPPHVWNFNFPAWSISVEMAVSLGFFFVARRATERLALLLVAIGSLLAWHELSHVIDPASNHLAVFNSGLLRGVAGFCVGVASFLAVRLRPASFAAARLAFIPLLALLLAMFVFPRWDGLAGDAAAAIFTASLFLLLGIGAVCDNDPLLTSRPLVYLGAISYAVYLLHIPILLTAETIYGAVPPSAKFGMLAVVLAAAALCHRFFELPAQRLVLSRLAPNLRELV